MFIDNKYKNLYFKIIDNAKNRQLEVSGESHHIIPRSFGGSNSSDNLVLLTYREHFICHWLLTKFTDGANRNKMLYAMHMMTRNRFNNSRVVASWQFEVARKLFVEACKNRTFSDETRSKMSASASGRKKSSETCKKMSERQIGSKNHMFGKRGELHHNYGFTHSNDVKERIKETKRLNSLTCVYCNKTMPLANYNRWHGNNCKVKHNGLAENQISDL